MNSPIYQTALSNLSNGDYGHRQGKMNRVAPLHNDMAIAERGSFMWGIVAITQIWLALKLMNEFEGYLSILLGTTGAAGVMVALILFRQESRDMLLHPLKHIQKEKQEVQVKIKDLQKVINLHLLYYQGI